VTQGARHDRRDGFLGRPTLEALAAGRSARQPSLFGVATLVEGGHVLLGGPAARDRGRQRRLVRAGLQLRRGLRLRRSQARDPARPVMGHLDRRERSRSSTLVVFVAFGVHVLAGGAFELRTVAR
jgi:hypothetical protein